MIDRSLILQVRRIEIRSRRAMSGPLAGLYSSAFKGRGLDFEEVRAYQPGDDVRSIDWKVTARRGAPYVKRFSEERQRTFWLLVDQSASMSFSSTGRTKCQAAVEVSAVIALAAAAHQDRVGLLTFGGPPRAIPTGKGSRHALRIVRDLLVENASSPDRADDDVEHAVRRLRHSARQRSMIFVVSDFLFDRPAEILGPLHRRHQVTAIRVADPLERRLPTVGLVRWRDSQTGQVLLIDTSDRAFRDAFEKSATRREQELRRTFSRWDMQYIALSTDESPARALLRHWSETH